MGAPSRPTLKVEYRPDEASIHHVRLMVHSFVLLTTKDRALAGRLTVTCAELVEDAARRISTVPCTLEIELDVTGYACVQLTSEVIPALDTQLTRVVEEVNRSTPIEAYTRALSQTAAGAESLLSLARVRYEGQMTLTLRRAGSFFFFFYDFIINIILYMCFF